MRISKKLTAGLATGIAALSIATGAFAYFTADGSGFGTAAVGSDSGLTVEVDNNIGGLYPEGSVPMAYHITNNSTGTAVVVEQLYPSIGTDKPGCTAADFSFDSAFPGHVSIDPNETKDYTGTLSMPLADRNQDACKGATVTVTLSTTAP